MKKKQLIDVLSAHANALNDGADISEPLLTRYPEQAGELASLFRLASSARAALMPVTVPIAFRIRLGRELANYAVPETVMAPPLGRQRLVWLGVAAAGSVLSIAGIVLLVMRRVRSASSRRPSTATTAA